MTFFSGSVVSVSPASADSAPASSPAGGSGSSYGIWGGTGLLVVFPFLLLTGIVRGSNCAAGSVLLASSELFCVLF